MKNLLNKIFFGMMIISTVPLSVQLSVQPSLFAAEDLGQSSISASNLAKNPLQYSANDKKVLKNESKTQTFWRQHHRKIIVGGVVLTIIGVGIAGKFFVESNLKKYEKTRNHNIVDIVISPLRNDSLVKQLATDYVEATSPDKKQKALEKIKVETDRMSGAHAPFCRYTKMLYLLETAKEQWDLSTFKAPVEHCYNTFDDREKRYLNKTIEAPTMEKLKSWFNPEATNAFKTYQANKLAWNPSAVNKAYTPPL